MGHARITKGMTFNEVFAICPDAPEVLTKLGLKCHQCAIAWMSTVEDCAVMHDLDVDALVEKLNERAKTAGADEAKP